MPAPSPAAPATPRPSVDGTGDRPPQQPPPCARGADAYENVAAEAPGPATYENFGAPPAPANPGPSAPTGGEGAAYENVGVARSSTRRDKERESWQPLRKSSGAD